MLEIPTAPTTTSKRPPGILSLIGDTPLVEVTQIDTGTSTTAITPELAKELNVATSPIPPVTSGGAHVDVTAGALQSFQVGGAKIDNLAVIVADFFSVLSQAIGAKLDGIVGYNFLRDYKVVIDYPNELLSLF